MEIVELADARAAARRAHDWPTADELRSRIEAAGWKVVDTGTMYDLERAVPEDVLAGDEVRYGSSASVPSRLDEAPTAAVTVVLLATDWPDDLEHAVVALGRDAPHGTQLVIVANGPSEVQESALPVLMARVADRAGLSVEVVRTAGRLGHATALNAGIRRAAAPVVILLDAAVAPGSGLVPALTAVLEDATVAVAGPVGLVSDDLVRFRAAAPGATDVDAVDGCALAFRRSDYLDRGPLDEHFEFGGGLDAWWSLVLRDQGEKGPGDAPPRRAVQVGAGQVTRLATRDASGLSSAERERLARKNAYRLLKRFATRRDLLTGGAG